MLSKISCTSKNPELKSTDFYLCFCFNTLLVPFALGSFLYFVLHFVRLLRLRVANIRICAMEKWAVIYFPYCACAPLQKNIFDRIRGKYLLKEVSMVDRMHKQQQHIVCEKKSAEISTDFIWPSFCHSQHHFVRWTLPVCYFLWENKQFNWLLDA